MDLTKEESDRIQSLAREAGEKVTDRVSDLCLRYRNKHGEMTDRQVKAIQSRVFIVEGIQLAIEMGLSRENIRDILNRTQQEFEADR